MALQLPLGLQKKKARSRVVVVVLRLVKEPVKEQKERCFVVLLQLRVDLADNCNSGPVQLEVVQGFRGRKRRRRMKVVLLLSRLEERVCCVVGRCCGCCVLQ
jgi:hypothetical protein